MGESQQKPPNPPRSSQEKSYQGLSGWEDHQKMGGWEDKQEKASAMLLGCDLDWFAVVTVPQNEIRARDNLARRKVDCFVPTYSKVVRQKGRKRFVERRLFPGYVLVGFEPGQTRWDIVRDAGGVFAIVAAAGRPLRIPNDHVGTLMVGAMLGRFDVEQHRLGAKVTMRLPEVAGNPIKRFGRIVSLVEKGDHPGVSVLWGGHGAESLSTVPLDALELAA